jgi:hypothetical protein
MEVEESPLASASVAIDVASRVRARWAPPK